MRPHTSILVVSFIFTAVFTYAQTGDTDKKVLETKVTELYLAMVQKDKNTLENLTSETLTYGHSSGTIENKSEYVDAIMNGQFEFISIDPSDQTVSFSGDTAIVRHIFNAKGKNDGKAVDVRIGVLMVFQKHKEWKLLARQAYKL